MLPNYHRNKYSRYKECLTRKVLKSHELRGGCAGQWWECSLSMYIALGSILSKIKKKEDKIAWVKLGKNVYVNTFHIYIHTFHTHRYMYVQLNDHACYFIAMQLSRGSKRLSTNNILLWFVLLNFELESAVCQYAVNK